jgi:hypothetical protein
MLFLPFLRGGHRRGFNHPPVPSLLRRGRYFNIFIFKYEDI